MIEGVRYVAFHAPTAPAGRQWLGQIFILPVPTAKVENPAEVPFNMNFWSSSRDGCLKAAEKFWISETARLADRRGGIAARTEKAKATRAAKAEGAVA